MWKKIVLLLFVCALSVADSDTFVIRRNFLQGYGDNVFTGSAAQKEFVLPKKFRCPKCVELGSKSKITITNVIQCPSSEESFWGEDGVWTTKKKPEVFRIHYHCSKGHDWFEKYKEHK